MPDIAPLYVNSFMQRGDHHKIVRTRITLAVLSLLVVAGGLVLHGCFASSAEHSNVRDRYEQMRQALLVNDTNAATLLFAPAHRARARDHFGVLSNFTLPLGLKSVISIHGSRATVCPERIFIIPFLNGGHTIEMIEVDGEWYFTGKLSIW